MQRPYIFGILKQIRQMSVRDPSIDSYLECCSSNAANQSFLCRKAQLEISDVEVSWHETSPACAYCIQMGHRRDWVYTEAHLHLQYSSRALSKPVSANVLTYKCCDGRSVCA